MEELGNSHWMTPKNSKIKDLLSFDRELSKTNLIIGTDEAGRGPGAGPVYAAAVYFPNYNKELEASLEELNDSKKLTPNKREKLFDIIKSNSIYSINSISAEKIDKINILQASLTAMKKSCEDVLSQIKNPQNPKILVDGKIKIRNINIEQQTIVKGDSTSASIAAASILAKVARDTFMIALAKDFPQYGWAQNKGYLTKAHLEAIKEHGITKWHRKSFLKNYIQGCSFSQKKLKLD